MASHDCIQWVLLADGDVAPGDVVSADAGGMPIYKVVAVDDGKALLEDDRHAALQTLPLDRFRWKAAAATV